MCPIVSTDFSPFFKQLWNHMNWRTHINFIAISKRSIKRPTWIYYFLQTPNRFYDSGEIICWLKLISSRETQIVYLVTLLYKPI